MDGSTAFNPTPWLLGRNEIRTLARRRYRFVGAEPGARILVVGCGTGDDALAIARLVRPGGRAFGIDRIAANLLEARRRAATAGLAAKFHLGAPDDLPFPDASFDGVCTAWVVPGPAEPGAIVPEMLRVIRPGGRVVLDDIDWKRATIAGGDHETARRVLAHAEHLSGLSGMRDHLEALARAEGVVNLTASETEIRDVTGGTSALFAALARHAAQSGTCSNDDAEQFAADLGKAVGERRYAVVLPCVTLAGQRA